MSKWSAYQDDIFSYLRENNGHCVVNAVAGSGKSTTGVECVAQEYGRSMGMKSMQFLAFNKHIEIDLNEKFKKRGLPQVCSTYNGYGNRIIRANGIRSPFDQFKDHGICRKVIRDSNLRRKLQPAIVRIVSLLKNLLLLPTVENVKSVMATYDIEVKEELRFDLIGLATKIATESMNDHSTIDFNDQKYLPIKLGLSLVTVDELLVDEFQDSCPVEIALVRRLVQQGSRVSVFGDPWQAIYSFKGTAADAMELFASEFKATTLPLSLCYRCSKSVITEAQTIVPHIEAVETSVQGEVSTVSVGHYRERVTNNDLVLCRCTADLVSSVLYFLGRGKPAHVLGSEVGDQLMRIVDAVYDSGMTLPSFIGELRDYVQKKVAYYQELENEERVELLLDTQSALLAIAEGVDTVGNLVDKIESLSRDNGGITHMTIHKSKGLESEVGATVWILRPDKLPLPKARNVAEEMRLKYVAITRSRQGNLCYVTD